MPDWVTLGADLASAGGWAVVVTIIAALGVGFVRKWFVPGWIFEREVKRGDDQAATIAAFTKSIDAMADEVKWLGRNAPR